MLSSILKLFIASWSPTHWFYNDILDIVLSDILIWKGQYIAFFLDIDILSNNTQNGKYVLISADKDSSI